MPSTTGHNLAVHGGFQGGFGGTWRGGVAWGRGLHGDVGRLVLRCVAVGLARRRCVAWWWDLRHVVARLAWGCMAGLRGGSGVGVGWRNCAPWWCDVAATCMSR